MKGSLQFIFHLSKYKIQPSSIIHPLFFFSSMFPGCKKHVSFFGCKFCIFFAPVAIRGVPSDLGKLLRRLGNLNNSSLLKRMILLLLELGLELSSSSSWSSSVQIDQNGWMRYNLCTSACECVMDKDGF